MMPSLAQAVRSDTSLQVMPAKAQGLPEAALIQEQVITPTRSSSEDSLTQIGYLPDSSHLAVPQAQALYTSPDRFLQDLLADKDFEYFWEKG